MPSGETRPPSIEFLLSRPEGFALAARHGRERTKAALQGAAARLRERALGPGEPASLILDAATKALDARPASTPPRVVNATGVLLHTNLGRAPLAAAARAAILEASGSCALEIDLETGERGHRDAAVRALVREAFLSGTAGTDAFVVNNNAAAVLLALDTVANGSRVAISRGELVAIGGDFRVPSILAKSGASLLEVGTTNRTTIDDYREALDAGASAILKVHPSNFRIVGYARETELRDLGALALERALPLVYDAGAAAPFPLPRGSGWDGPDPAAALALGVSIVTFSGDKTLGGPQAGILAGGAAWIERAAKNPLARALRLDKLGLAALAATLDLVVSGRAAEIPFFAMLEAPVDGLTRRAEALAAVAGNHALRAVAVETEAVAGGGSGAETTLASAALALSLEGLSAEDLLAALRRGSPPIIGRIADGRVLLDLRSVPPEDDATIASALAALNSG